MPNFKNFATGGDDEGFSPEPRSIRYKQTRDTRVGTRMEKVWATDFERCESREDYEKYITKYGKYEANNYIHQAKAKLESINAEESGRIEREKSARLDQNSQTFSTYDSVNTGSTIKSNVLKICFRVFFWIAIITGVGGITYYQYVQTHKKATSPVLVFPTTNPQNTQDFTDQPVSPTQSGNAATPETPVVQTAHEAATTYLPCTLCGQTGQCGVCHGVSRCGGCGGSGQIFSVFYGDEVGPGRLTECGACGGSGACGACSGSGVCEHCNGHGQVELTY